MRINYQEMKSAFVRFKQDETGATAIEYTIIAAVIGASLVATMAVLTSSISSTFADTADKVSTATREANETP